MKTKMHVAGSHRLTSSLYIYLVILLTSKIVGRNSQQCHKVWAHVSSSLDPVNDITQYKNGKRQSKTHISTCPLYIKVNQTELKKCWWNAGIEKTSVLIWRSPLWTSVNTVKTGCSHCPFVGKANWETDRAHCSQWHTTRALQLIYSHRCLFIEGERTAFFISWKETKKPASSDRNSLRSVRQNGRSRKLNATNKMLFTSAEHG